MGSSILHDLQFLGRWPHLTVAYGPAAYTANFGDRAERHLVARLAQSARG